MRDYRIAAIPADPGAYYEQGDHVKALTMADYKVITDKKRQALKVLSPVPLIARSPEPPRR